MVEKVLDVGLLRGRRTETYLQEWVARQTSKRNSSDPSAAGQKRMRECVAWCVLMDWDASEGPGHLRYEILGHLARDETTFIKTLYTAMSSVGAPTYCKAFDRAYLTHFKVSLKAVDKYNLLNHDDTRTKLIGLIDPHSSNLSAKIAALKSQIELITNTHDLIHELRNSVEFGAVCYPDPSDLSSPEPDPYVKLTARTYFQACKTAVARNVALFLESPVRIARVVGAEITPIERLANEIKGSAAVKALGTAAFESTITFSEAKLTFTAEGRTGAAASANGSLRRATREDLERAAVERELPTLVEASGSLEAFVGCEVKTTVALESSHVDASVSFEQLLGAKASASGKFEVTPTGFSAGVAMEAFVGYKATATGKATFKLFGMPILEQTVTASVMAGAGGKFEAQIGADIEKGLNLKFTAEASVGVGAGLGTETTVNQYHLVLAAKQAAVELWDFSSRMNQRRQGYMLPFEATERMNGALIDRYKSELVAMKRPLQAEKDRLDGLRAKYGV